MVPWSETIYEYYRSLRSRQSPVTVD